MSKAKTSLIIAGAAILGSAIFGASLFTSGFSSEETTFLYVDSDDNVDSIYNKLQDTNKPSSNIAFNLLASAFNLEDRIKTGRYEISTETSILQLIRHIRNHNELPVNLVVPSVRTIGDMAERLSEHLMIDSATIAERLCDESVLNELGYTKETVPALFIPNTYQVYWDISAEELVNRLVKENKAFWNEEREAKITKVAEYAGMELTKNDIVTLASIVDSETANNGEKANIAGLYLNRLKIGMPLQSDPTVKFALQNFALKRIMHEHLNADSPYNTYKNPGLPPGPICVPSIAGIDAVLNHAHHDYIYMCAKEDFSGTHNFAVSYSEHLKNASRYTKALNERNIH